MTETVERFIVTGIVQGVFYRKWTKATADGLGLRGFVRNRSDGSVEAVLAGDQSRLDAFAEAARAGPDAAAVESVARSPADRSDVDGYERAEIADDA
ncbi:acylphosphatase [Hansschlegelia quercus]|uniref:acylphosphatase n=1 Tax=Hansschlegelia quercus TaxID=2528245 RepID=A0A4Q9GNB9_9HYPH|nr:acylphosphatase [Hansschlegelia quercus]TBN54244.1 acylphosphatase [Hansschlegelia quercus]